MKKFSIGKELIIGVVLGLIISGIIYNFLSGVDEAKAVEKVQKVELEGAEEVQYIEVGNMSFDRAGAFRFQKYISIEALKLGDIDGDGDLDIVLGGDRRVYILENKISQKK